MYKRDRDVDSNYYLLNIFEDSLEEGEVGEEIATIYSEDPIPIPDDGDHFDISLLQMVDAEADLATEQEDSFLINNTSQSYAIIEHEEDQQALLHMTNLIVESAEE